MKTFKQLLEAKHPDYEDEDLLERNETHESYRKWLSSKGKKHSQDNFDTYRNLHGLSDEHAAKIKKGLDEDASIDDFTLEEIQEFVESEEYEQLDELSKATLGSYIKKASGKLSDYSYGHGFYDRDRGDSGTNHHSEKKSLDLLRKSQKRERGISKAVKKLVGEETEHLDELSKQTLGSYIKKSIDDKSKDRTGNVVKAAEKLRVNTKGDTTKGHKEHRHDALAATDKAREHDTYKSGNHGYAQSAALHHDAREKHIKAAKSADNEKSRKFHISKADFHGREAKDNLKYANESTVNDSELLDELSKQTLGSYIKKASDSKVSGGIGIVTKTGKSQDTAADKYLKRNRGISKAVGKLTKESEDIDDEDDYQDSRNVYCPKCGKNHGKSKEYGSENLRSCSTCGYKAKKLAKEEIEQLTELSLKTLGSYLNKNAASKNKHFDAAQHHKSAASALDNAATHISGKDKDVIKSISDEHKSAAEFHKNKVAKRYKGWDAAAKRIVKEEIEQLDEETISKLQKHASNPYSVGASVGVHKSDEGHTTFKYASAGHRAEGKKKLVAAGFKAKHMTQSTADKAYAYRHELTVHHSGLNEGMEHDHIQQTLADKDINSKIENGKIVVHKDNVIRAKNHVKKLGHKTEVVSGLNEGAHHHYNSGYEAKKSGKSRRDNPYAEGSTAAHHWAQGWEHASDAKPKAKFTKSINEEDLDEACMAKKAKLKEIINKRIKVQEK